MSLSSCEIFDSITQYIFKEFEINVHGADIDYFPNDVPYEARLMLGEWGKIYIQNKDPHILLTFSNLITGNQYCKIIMGNTLEDCNKCAVKFIKESLDITTKFDTPMSRIKKNLKYFRDLIKDVYPDVPEYFAEDFPLSELYLFCIGGDNGSVIMIKEEDNPDHQQVIRITKVDRRTNNDLFVKISQYKHSDFRWNLEIAKDHLDDFLLQWWITYVD